MKTYSLFCRMEFCLFCVSNQVLEFSVSYAGGVPEQYYLIVVKYSTVPLKIGKKTSKKNHRNPPSLSENACSFFFQKSVIDFDLNGYLEISVKIVEQKPKGS